MNDYTEISKAVEVLGYRDKLRLAQLLIQLARKEEEEQKPEARVKVSTDPNSIQQIADKLKKLKPGKKDSALNSIGAMFQFQGGITEPDKEKIFAELVKGKHLFIDAQNRISY